MHFTVLNLSYNVRLVNKVAGRDAKMTSCYTWHGGWDEST